MTLFSDWLTDRQRAYTSDWQSQPIAACGSSVVNALLHCSYISHVCSSIHYYIVRLCTRNCVRGVRITLFRSAVSPPFRLKVRYELFDGERAVGGFTANDVTTINIVSHRHIRNWHLRISVNFVWAVCRVKFADGSDCSRSPVHTLSWSSALAL